MDSDDESQSRGFIRYGRGEYSVKWYQALVPNKYGPCLFQQPEVGPDNFIVCWTPRHKKNGKEMHYFAAFGSYIDFYHYVANAVSDSDIHCFYEVIRGSSRQKPHFDIDIKREDYTGDDFEGFGERVKDALIQGCCDVIHAMNHESMVGRLNVELDISQHVLVCTSHGPDKRSYHLVLGGFYHVSNVEARAFYDNVMNFVDRIDPTYRIYIDSSPYSPTQQFRIVGSHKLGKSRVKTFQPTFAFGEKIIHHQRQKTIAPLGGTVSNPLDELEETCITHVGNCIQLPLLAPLNPDRGRIQRKARTYDRSITLATSDAALELFLAKYPDQVGAFSISQITGPYVCLRRIMGSYCHICYRFHDSENPYIYVGDDGVWFDCRRHEGRRRLPLGPLRDGMEGIGSVSKEVKYEDPDDGPEGSNVPIDAFFQTGTGFYEDKDCNKLKRELDVALILFNNADVEMEVISEGLPSLSSSPILLWDISFPFEELIWGVTVPQFVPDLTVARGASDSQGIGRMMQGLPHILPGTGKIKNPTKGSKGDGKGRPKKKHENEPPKEGDLKDLRTTRAVVSTPPKSGRKTPTSARTPPAPGGVNMFQVRG